MGQAKERSWMDLLEVHAKSMTKFVDEIVLRGCLDGDMLCLSDTFPYSILKKKAIRPKVPRVKYPVVFLCLKLGRKCQQMAHDRLVCPLYACFRGDYMEYTNSNMDYLISEHIHSDRDRRILRRRLIDGACYEMIAEEFEMSVRQIKAIVYREQGVLFRHI